MGAATQSVPDQKPRDRGSDNHGPGRGPRKWRSRDRRHHDGDRARPPSDQPERKAAEDAPRDRDGQRRENRERDQRPDNRARGPRQNDRERGPRRNGKKPFGKGRDGPREKPQPKLYSFESVVDRGFEDVADDANQGATRRVDWTIVKRTVADQRSAKTVSAVYVLKRDGAVTDFANLAAARAAVHKTIVHPEKLTRAKADYASTKK